MKNYGLFDVTFLFIRLYNITNVDNKNGWMTFPPDTNKYTSAPPDIAQGRQQSAQGHQQAPIDVCGLPSYRGPCKGYFRRYYFDRATGECRLFPYGGCLGNLNNFRTEDICQARCGRQRGTVQPAGACGENEEQDICGTACPLTCENYQSPPEYCTLQCMIGCRCKQGYVRRADLRCVRTEECPNRPQEYSTSRPGLVRSTRPEQSRSTRPEYSRSTRPEQSKSTRQEYFRSTRSEQSRSTRQEYSRSTRPEQPRSTELSRSTSPEQFDSTQPEQLATPPASVLSDNAVCQQDKLVGPCQGAVTRYYYNKQRGQCEEFTFGGCGGNLNSFPTVEDCNSYCVDQS